MESPLEVSPHQSIEEEIRNLTEVVGRNRNATPETHKEIINEALRERAYSHAPSLREVTLHIQTPSSKRKGVLPTYLDNETPDVRLRIEQIIDTAYHKGIWEGYREAEKAGTFMLKAFHDALIDRLYDDMKRRGLIK